MLPEKQECVEKGTGDAFPSISVVLCCHNSAKRLPETLGHLARQQAQSGLIWEILVIDNASTDDTCVTVHQFATQYPTLPIRVVNEARLGQTYARQRGIVEALHEIILFVDDDNWLAPDYLAVLAETLRDHPEIAALGGMSTACCEGPEPAWLSKYQGWYAVTGASSGSELLKEENFLWTAGAAFRRSAINRADSLGLPYLMSGRRGDSLDGGEDQELCHLIRMSGGRLFRHSGLYFRHYLPQGRLTWQYLRRLHYAAGVVSVRLDVYRHGYSSVHRNWPAWLVGSWWAQMANVSWHILRHPLILWRSRRGPLEGSDRVLRLETYCGRLDALWSQRRSYRKMIAQSTVAKVDLKQTAS